MDGVLFKIQEDVINYANIISRISHVDVEVMDKSFHRVAGTGVFKNRINENMEDESFIYRKVLKTGETLVVQNPKEDPICNQCPSKENCCETFEISTPINLYNETIGVIGMMSNDEKSKDVITKNLDDYLALLEQIADFIASKAYEYNDILRLKETLAGLEDVSQHVDQGVLIIDNKNRLININESAKVQLGLGDHNLFQEIKIRNTGDIIEDSNEFEITIGNESHNIIGNLVEMEKYNNRIRRILIFSNLRHILTKRHEKQSTVYPLAIENIIGTSEETNRLREEILKVSKSNSTVLITGESGTGKEMVATAIWKSSDRKDQPFVAINCGAIPEPLLESELFGYVKGAFTGADSSGKVGKFELANNGIIFLDEIGDMPLYLQVKLLRVLQEREVTRLGSNRKIPLDVRVISATNKDLKEMVKHNQFREDLYYRLNVIPIHISPLRERIPDIEPIIFYIIKRYGELSSKKVNKIDEETLNILKLYPWPGNVREVENTIEYMINMMDEDGILDKDTLPENILFQDEIEHVERKIYTLEDLEKNEISKALEIYGNDTDSKKVVADKLGIGIATLYRKINKYNLE